MWMATFHLVADRVGDIVETKQTVVGRNLAVKNDLEQQISELVADCRRIAAGDRIGNLIGFLDRVRRDRLEILGDVPFATGLAIAQPRPARSRWRADG
jgi:hypothetical protein